jgi:phospholipid/cholesterol/gamma-HCH transport system substrate-binding protein
MRRTAVWVVATALVASSLAGCSLAGGVGGGSGYKLTAFFSKAVSLYNDSSVKVLGLPAGKVTSVKVVGDQVRVVMRINDDIPVPADVQAMLVPLSLIGERYVQLFPAWTHGSTRAKDGAVIPVERTAIPVEPDEALAAVKHLLDSLDPDATGRLITNLGQDLKGTGPDLNGALKSVADITTTFAEKDADLLALIDNFDDFTATLATRDVALGKVLDGFAQATGLLADERKTIESLVKNLASLSTSGLDITSKHATKLDRDLTVLTRTLQSVNLNIDRVRNLLDSAPLLVGGPNLDGTAGLAGAWDEKYHHLDLRNSVSPDAAALFRALGLPFDVICVPPTVECQPSTPAPTTTAVPAAKAPPKVKTTSPAAPREKDDLLRRVARSLAEVFS